MDKKEKFTAEIAKQLPVKGVYNDLLQPTLSTVGKSLQGATRVALAPITALVWGYDQISSYLDSAIPEYFEKRKIPKEKVISPDPAIAVPVIEAMRYTSHKGEIKAMFTNLLGSSMNSDSTDAHPAFVNIIKQLSADECKMISYLCRDDKLKEHSCFPNVIESEGVNIVEKKLYYELSEFGKNFCKVCLM